MEFLEKVKAPTEFLQLRLLNFLGVYVMGATDPVAKKTNLKEAKMLFDMVCTLSDAEKLAVLEWQDMTPAELEKMKKTEHVELFGVYMDYFDTIGKVEKAIYNGWFYLTSCINFGLMDLMFKNWLTNAFFVSSWYLKVNGKKFAQSHYILRACRVVIDKYFHLESTKKKYSEKELISTRIALELAWIMHILLLLINSRCDTELELEVNTFDLEVPEGDPNYDKTTQDYKTAQGLFVAAKTKLAEAKEVAQKHGTYRNFSDFAALFNAAKTTLESLK